MRILDKISLISVKARSWKHHNSAQREAIPSLQYYVILNPTGLADR